MNCYWRQLSSDDCTNPATNIIIYSCWNEHLKELAVCDHHKKQWQNEFHAYWLYCLECESSIVEWDHVDVNKLTIHYLLTRASHE